MPKFAYRRTPIVVGSYLYTDDAYTGIAIDSPSWFIWLSLGQTFYYKARQEAFTARCEKRRNSTFWYAFRRTQGKLHKVYLGSSAKLTRTVLDKTAARLAIATEQA